MESKPNRSLKGPTVNPLDSKAPTYEELRRRLAEAESRSEHLHQVLRAVRGVHQLIVSANDPLRLIEGAVERLTAGGGYQMAWIALLADTGGIAAIASRGFGEEIDRLREQLESGDFPRCVQQTIQKDEPELVRPSSTECADCPVHERCEESVRMTHCLEFADKVYGVLSVSFSAAFSGGAEEESLFSEIAGDLALALHRIETAEELDQHRSDLAGAQKMAGVGSWRLDLTTGRVVAHEEAKRIYGVEGEDFSIDYLKTIPLPQYRASLDEARANLLETGTPYDIEFEIRRVSDGEIRRIRSMADFDRERNSIVGAIQDITERRTLESSLREERQRLQFVIDGSRLGTWEWNLQTNETRFNETWATMLGYTLEELAPCNLKTWESLTHPQDLDEAKRRLAPCLAGEADDYICELRMRHKKGHWVWVLDRGRIMVRDAEGNPLLMFGTHDDISERKRVEEEVRDNAKRLQALTDILQYRAEDLDSFLEYAVGKAIELTESRCGHLFLYDEERQELVLSRWSRSANRECTVGSPQACIELADSGPWEEVVRQRKPLIENEFRLPDLAREKARAGDLEPMRLLAVPIFYQERIVAVVAVANKQSDYHETDALELTLLMDAVWTSVEKMKSTEALRESEEQFKTLFLESPLSIIIHDRETAEVIDANPAAIAFYGLSSLQELKEFNLWGDPPFSIDEAIANIRRASREGAQRLEWFSQVPGTDGFWEEVYLIPITINGVERILAKAIDITDRKRAEEALRWNEGYLRSILQTTAEGFWIIEKGRLIEVNEAYCAMSGYDRGELLGMGINDLDVQETPEETAARIERVLANRSEIFETRHRRKDGSVFPVEVSATFLPDYGGRLVCFCRDLSMRKQAEERLAVLGRMLDAAPASITIHDTEGRFHFANQKTVELHRFDSMEEFMQVNLHDLDVPETQALLPGRFREIAERGEASFEVAHYRKDGSVLPLAVLARSIEWEGRPSVLSIGVDITESKDAEERIQNAYDLLRNLADLVPGVIYQYRLYPDGRSCFPYSSSGMNLIYEVTPEEVREDATPVFGRLHPEDYDMVSEAIFRSARTLETFYCEFRVLLPRQGLRWRWSQAEPQRTEDGGTLWHGIILDVTERKEAEIEQERLREQLTQSQRLESVGRLAGGVAHDFNNMLNVIMGHSELMLEDLPAESDLREDVQEIHKAARRSADLTRQLLAFARKQTIALKVLDLNETIESMLRMLERLIGEDISLLWKPGRKLTPVRMDPAQIDQILANLVVNARDAIGHGVGKVTIETGMVFHDEEYCAEHPGFVPGRFVMLTVSDNGCGMDPETRKQIFEPFFTTKKSGEGTGLGLATIYGIVKQNLGFINVYSEVGKGTTFRIYFPAHESIVSLPPSEQLAAGPSARGFETVLLVEDETAILALGTRILERLGYNVLSAGKPSQAVDLAKRYSDDIHLLITDVIMPEMNGRELAGTLAEIHPEMKCLFMSGYTANVIAHHGVLDEGVFFIQKPFSSRDLAEKVRSTLDEVR